MRAFSRTILLSIMLASGLCAEPVSLIRAAELVTQFMETQKIEDKRLVELFSVSGLRRVQQNEAITPKTVIWRADLEETVMERDDPASQLVLIVDGKRHRRVLEIRQDGSIDIGVVFADVRQRIVPPPSNLKVVPAAPK